MSNPKKVGTVNVEVLGDELCVYDWASKRVHSLNNVAARVWQLCDGQHSPAEIAQTINAEFNTTNGEALVTLALEELNKAHLLIQPTEPQAVQPSHVNEPPALNEAGAPAVAHSILTRRHVIAGATAALIPIVISIVAPLPAAAQTPVNTLTPTSTATGTASGTATNTSTNTPTDTPTDTPTNTPTDTPTDTPTNTPTDTPTDTPTNTPTDTPTDTPTNTPTDTPIP